MKRMSSVLCILALLALAGVAWHGRTAAAAGSAPLGVDELMTKVDRYRGPVLVEGVVSSVAANQQMLALIDSTEFDACGVTTCARYTLPVSWGGAMPAVRSVVRVRGQVKEEPGGKLVFVATAVEAARASTKSR